MPYLRQCTPPEFSATLPPIVQAICEDGIGRIIEAGLADRLRHREIGDAGLDHGNAVIVIDLADAFEFGKPEQNAVAERQRAAGERGPAPRGTTLMPSRWQ